LQKAKCHLGGEATEEGEPKVAEREGKVLVKEITEEATDSQIRIPAVDEK
jgi:hypothetical protein